MAKGNDGNYLQHSLEVSAALHLAALTTERCLNVALTHGMGPYEPCGNVPNGQTRRLLDDSLSAARTPPTNGEPVIVDAYRRTNASRANYPNTGELLAATIGRDHLVGAITETTTAKYAQLMDKWQDSRVLPVNASWRQEVAQGGALQRAPVHPWLFSMDPMTYREDGPEDDDKIYRADRDRISNVLSQYVSTDMPGVATLFVFAVRPNERPLFWSFADDVATDTGMTINAFWLTHQGGNRNLAAVLSSKIEVRTDWLPPRLNVGR